MLKSKSIQERKTNQKQKLVTLTKKKLPKHTGAYRQSAILCTCYFFILFSLLIECLKSATKCVKIKMLKILKVGSY